MPDIFQGIDALDAEGQELIATRLERRAENALFTAVRERYFDRVRLPAFGRIHELGCGTGVVTRALAQRLPETAVSGSDLSAVLIEQAKALARKEGLAIDFFRADAQESGGDSGYDLVLGHTLISHVNDPVAVLTEALRLTRPGGRLILHDGDYASFAFDSGKPELDRRMPEVYTSVAVANPHIMRVMPRLIAEAGARIEDVFGDVIIDGAPDGYFANVVQNFAPFVRKARPELAGAVDAWIASCAAAAEAGVFYGSCVFTTYVFGKPG